MAAMALNEIPMGIFIARGPLCEGPHPQPIAGPYLIASLRRTRPYLADLPHTSLAPKPPRDHRRGVWHRDSHPGATIPMKLRPRRTLKQDATLDVIGRRYHPWQKWSSPESPWLFIHRGHLRPHPQATAGLLAST